MRIFGIGVPELVVIGGVGAVLALAIALMFLPLIVMGANWKHGKDTALRRGAWSGMLMSAIGCTVAALCSLASGAWGSLVPLFWVVPLACMGYGVMKGTRANSVALGVCTLLLSNLISGILLLCSEKGSTDGKPEERPADPAEDDAVL